MSTTQFPQSPGPLFRIAGGCLLVLAATQRSAPADVLFGHYGHADPVDEGWSSVVGSPGISAGPVDAPPVSAWFVEDVSSDPGSFLFYESATTPCQGDVDELGWTLRACLRTDDPDSEDSVFVLYNNAGTRRFDMWFNSSAVTLLETTEGCGGIVGRSYSITGAEPSCHASDFIQFELVYDPVTQTADLFVNGVEQISNYAGHNELVQDFDGVIWGAGSSCGQGYGEFHLVEFEVPIPLCTCPWDCGGDPDGNVGIVDFLALLAQWNQTGTGCDFDGQGVGINEFLTLLANWGPCP
jgi:hypothetical protein